MTTTTPQRVIRCRYRRRNDEMCANPALDQAEGAAIYLCGHHAARVLELVREHKALKTAVKDGTTS